MMESLNSITAHVQRMWEPIITEIGSQWTYGSHDQYLRMRLSHVEEDAKILWDVLVYRMSNGSKGAEITSKYMWTQLLKTPDIRELKSLSEPIWNLEIRKNRNKENLLPLINRRSKHCSSRSTELVADAKYVMLRLPNITENLNSTITDLHLLTHFLAHNSKNFKSHRSYYLRLRKKVRLWRHLVKVSRRIVKRLRHAKENLFITLRPYQRVQSWLDKCRRHNETAERMRYRVTYGDIKSNVLDIANQLFWIKGDTKRAKKILKQITPRIKSLKDRIDQLWGLTYHDLMTDEMKAFLQSARNNFLVLHGLSRQLGSRTPDLATKCAYLDVIVSPIMYEKARVDVALGKVLRRVAFAIKEGQIVINASKPYTALSAFMTRHYDDGYYAPIERLLDRVKDIHKRAAMLLEDSLTTEAFPESAMRGEGFMLVSSELRPRRHLLWWWQDKDDDGDKTTITTSPTTVITSSPTSTMTTTTRGRTKPRKTKEPTKPTAAPTTAATKPKPKPITKPEKTPSVKPTPAASTVNEIITEPQTDFYFDGDNDDVTAQRNSQSGDRSRPQDVRSKEIQFYDDEDFGFSGSGLASGDIDEDLLITRRPVTSPTTPPTTTLAPPTPPTTTLAPPTPWIDWKAIRKLVKKSAKPLKKDGKKQIQKLNSIEKSENDLFYRINSTTNTHGNIKRTHKRIARNLDLTPLKRLDGKSDRIGKAVDDVIQREEILRRKCQNMVFDKAPFMEKYKQTLMSLDSYAQGSYSTVASEMKQLRRQIKVVEEVSTNLYKKALTMNETIKDLSQRMDILRDKIQTARIALAGIRSKVQISGSATYTLQQDLRSESFQPGSLHFKIRTNQPDGAIIAIQGSGRSPLRNIRRIRNRLSVGLDRGKVSVYVEPWRSKWTLPGIINDGRWHEINIYTLPGNILITDSVMSNAYRGEYTEVQRRMYNVPERIDIKQYFRRKYFFIIGKLPHATWPFNPDPQFRACLSELRVSSFYLPMFSIQTVNRTVAQSCSGELLTSSVDDWQTYREPELSPPPKWRPISVPFVNNTTNVYALYGARVDQFMFHVWYLGQPEGGVVVFLALSPTLHISLHHRHRRIVVTLIEGERYASAVCRTFGTDQSAHSIFAVALGRRIEFNIDCNWCQSMPFLSSISRHFPFYKPELIVAPTHHQLDHYLYGRPRARRQVAPFNGVITRVTIDGIVLYNSAIDKPACNGDLDISHLISLSRRRAQK